ncbi:hypothetical protein KIN20_002519 [Parelaphostrongylus tenuis]|uniref:Uncharacterized protein n=1 Tax=Parelaphostrongylus tenuis TaxID=148309 RepID=A0AAD5MGX8_PARTN|nr:hypothetical protein KIN20_002519 [Parelaphostrongylus tenuis]
MEQVTIPLGKKLRYRCDVSGCRSDMSYSMSGITEHLAEHYAQIKDSKDHYNYQCRNCGRYFVYLGMTVSCYCRWRNNTESNCVVITKDWSSSAARKDFEFMNYVEQHATAVFVTYEANGMGSSSGAVLARGHRASRSPSTARSPRWKSRQDALLLENPSPPRTPRRTV